VFVCSACDGWQPLESQYELTRHCCQLLLEAGFALQILTKSDLILRDLDVLAGGNVSVGVTITTADETLAKLWEPEASSVAARLNVLRQAKRAGLKTTLMCGPLLPGLSDTSAALAQLYGLDADLQVDKIWTDTMNARPLVWPAVQQLVRRHWPKLEKHFRQILFERRFRQAYGRVIEKRISQAMTAAARTPPFPKGSKR
jgi:DNA repair photolyase